MNLPTDYAPCLSTREVEAAIKDIKDFFQDNLAAALGLERVTGPLFVRSGTGVNDDLNGVERPIRFNVKEDENAPVEIVQSLAKWKRMALRRYGFKPGEGLYTDMNAIRPDETLDNLTRSTSTNGTGRRSSRPNSAPSKRSRTWSGRSTTWSAGPSSTSPRNIPTFGPCCPRRSRW